VVAVSTPIARFFASLDLLLERVQPTWWGAVVTEPRFPDVHDLNYARVDTAQPDLTLSEVEDVLLPAARDSGARHFHVVVFEPEGCGILLGQLERAGHHLSADTVMRFEGGTPARDRTHEVEALPPGEELWVLLERAFREFGIAEETVRDQVLAWNRLVLAPAGRRWFVVRHVGGIVGMGSIHVMDDVGYVDDVLTMPTHRGRGIASAVVQTLVRWAREHGAEHVLLLADQPGPIRLYRSLGFAETGRVVGALSRLGAGASQARGSSGSAAESDTPPVAAPGAGSSHGDQPG
jgi:GNAT superfamily N-acetyltransferase